MAEKILQGLFLREMPSKIMFSLKTAKQPVYATILSRETNCTYSHTIKILGTLQKLNLVSFEKTGRMKKVRLTDAGWDIGHQLEAIMKRLGQLEETADKTDKQKPEKKAKKQTEK